MADLLEDAQIELALADLPGWKRSGKEMECVFTFKKYLEGVDFVQKVAVLADHANHHPDMVVGWRKVTVRLVTHLAGGLTALDFDLARQIDALLV